MGAALGVNRCLQQPQLLLCNRKFSTVTAKLGSKDKLRQGGVVTITADRESSSVSCIVKVFYLIVTLSVIAGIKGDSIHAEYLTSNQRLHNSPYIDSYFQCNICGRDGRMQWVVDTVNSIGHRGSASTGSVSYQTAFGDSTFLHFVSMILSKRSELDNICMDVVLLVVQQVEEFQMHCPQVVCRGTTQQFAIQIPDLKTSLDPDQTESGTVKVTYILHQSNIVSLGSDFVTRIFLCWTNESSHFWLRNGNPAGGFNRRHSAGTNIFTLHSNNSAVTLHETVLIAEVDLVSVLLVTDYNSNISSNISCVSNRNLVMIVVNNLDMSHEDSANDTAVTTNATAPATDSPSGSFLTTTLPAYEGNSSALLLTSVMISGLFFILCLIFSILLMQWAYLGRPCNIFVNIIIKCNNCWHRNERNGNKNIEELTKAPETRNEELEREFSCSKHEITTIHV